MINLTTWIISVILFGSGSCRSEQPEQEQNKPNILWIVCEDQWSDFFPMYGDSTVRLPTLEQLAD